MPSDDIKLGELIRVKHGFAFKGEHFVDEPSSHVLVTPGNFAIGGGFQIGKLKYYLGPIPAEYVLKPGDLIVTMTDLSKAVDTLGYGARVPNHPGRTYLHNQRIGLVEPLQPTRISLRWLHYLLRTPEYRAWVVGSASGSTVKHTSPGRICEFSIRLPDMATQETCASVLDALEARIDLLRQTNATLESIAQALFKSWFIDFDPVRAKAEGREPEGMDAATAALFPAEFEESALGAIPRGWRVQWLGDWLTALETGRRPKGGVGGIQSGVPSIGAESITRVGIFDFTKTKYISDDFFVQMKSGILKSHDVLLYKDGGKPGIFLPRVSMFGDGYPFEKCAINEHVFRLRVKEPLGQQYLYFWIWSDAVMHELRHRGGKAAIPGINQSDVREQRLLIPCAEVCTKFNELAAPMFSKIFGNARTVQSLEDLRNSLLPRLISGKLRLPEAQAQLEDALA